MRMYGTIRIIIISALALTILFSVYRTKAFKLRMPLSISILYVVIYDIWDFYKPITALPFQLLWIAAIIFSITGVILFYRQKSADEINNKP